MINNTFMTKFSKIVILMEVKVGISMRDDDNFVESMINPLDFSTCRRQ